MRVIIRGFFRIPCHQPRGFLGVGLVCHNPRMAPRKYAAGRNTMFRRRRASLAAASLVFSVLAGSSSGSFPGGPTGYDVFCRGPNAIEFRQGDATIPDADVELLRFAVDYFLEMGLPDIRIAVGRSSEDATGIDEARSAAVRDAFMASGLEPRQIRTGSAHPHELASDLRTVTFDVCWAPGWRSEGWGPSPDIVGEPSATWQPLGPAQP